MKNPKHNKRTLLLVGLMKGQHEPERYAIPLATLSFVAILGMGTAREALRMTYLRVFEYFFI